MDDAERHGAERQGAEGAATGETDTALAVVFGMTGFTLVMTLDAPWAGLPLVAVGLSFGVRSIRRALRRRDAPGGSDDA